VTTRAPGHERNGNQECRAPAHTCG
jgi:hypothetical protein